MIEIKTNVDNGDKRISKKSMLGLLNYVFNKDHCQRVMNALAVSSSKGEAELCFLEVICKTELSANNVAKVCSVHRSICRTTSATSVLQYFSGRSRLHSLIIIREVLILTPPIFIPLYGWIA